MAASAAVRPFQGRACSRCLADLLRHPPPESIPRRTISIRRTHGGIVPNKHVQRNMTVHTQGFMHEYFSANTSIDRGWVRSGILAAWRTVAEPPTEKARGHAPESAVAHQRQRPDNESTDEPASAISTLCKPPDVSSRETDNIKVHTETTDHLLPHRRRRRKTSTDPPPNDEPSLPLDASSQLTTAATALPASAVYRRKFATYLSLTKPRLSFLIILTTTSAYSLYPIPDILSSANSAVDVSTTLSTSTLTLLFLTTGTFLSCACANTLNMLFEPKYDAMMSRTRNRPLVRGLVSKRAAAIFALLCGATGLLLLDLGTNSTVAGLSALNIFLYAGVYTPMKRISAANTWAGAVVGAIPPLMGWCAAAGQAATSEHHSWRDLLLSEDSIGGWLLAGLLFAWQFPHFNSLSHTIRDDYRNAGHKMLAWTNPARNARVALRYSVAMFPICFGLYWAGTVNQGFLAVSTVCNVWMLREAVQFWRKQGAGGSARGLFWASVWQLPLVLVGALVCKTGIWDGFFSSTEPTSVFEEGDDIERDGQPLGMTSLHNAKSLESTDRLNPATMGYSRPG